MRFPRLLVILRTARSRGIPIVWTAHNVEIHENFHPRLGDLFYRTFIPFVDGCIGLSTDHIATLQERFPGSGPARSP